MYSTNTRRNDLRAFSLLEVSIVIMIIGVLIVGVVGSRHLVKKARISAAIAMTRSSPISSILNNKIWLESSLAEVSIGEDLSTGDLIDSWQDNFSNQNIIEVTSVGTGPAYSNSINSIQAVKFDSDSSSNHLKINNASFLNSTDYTIFIVEKRMDTNGVGGNYLLGESGSFALGYESGVSIIQTHGEASSTDNQTSIETLANYSNKPRIITATHSSTDGNKIYINTTLANEDETSNAITHLSGITELKIGNDYNGEIGEIVIFDRDLKTSERNVIENYLSDKWDAPNNRDVTSSCTSGTITSEGCDPSCTVSINGVTDTLVDTGSSASFTCNDSSAYSVSDTIAYSCSGGILEITGDATCDCASGYALTSGAGTVCVQGCSVGTISGSSASDTTVTNGTEVSCDLDGFEAASIGTCSAPGSISGSCSCADGGSEVSGTCVTLNCSGGDTVIDGSVTGMRIHTFSTAGSSTFSCTNSEELEVLVVAGGAGGGGHSGWDSGGGGGGAGGLIHSSSYTASAGSNITVTVGTGGAGGSATVHEAGHNGEDSVFGSLTSLGGGGGGSRNRTGADGGSGGGSNADGLAGSGTIGQGTDGLAVRGGGGGGAGYAATDSDGGNGLQYDITGTSTYYAGGGAGKHGSYGTGGLGGGGDAGSVGTDGTGGGGGAHTGGSSAGSDGGDGIVIVRYYDSDVSAAQNLSVTCSVSGVSGIADSSSLGYAPVSTALKCSETGYQGYVTYTCTSSGTAAISGSCELIQCSISGVTGLDDTTTLPYTSSSSSLSCNAGYDGTPTYTCISPRSAAISGSCTDILCSISGITGLSDVSGLAYSASAVSTTCEEGFENPPTYTCTATGSATMSGSCSAITCDMTSVDGVEDTSTIAYTADTVAYDCDSTDYIGQVQYTCTATGAASITGECFDSASEELVCSGGVISDLSGSSGPTTHVFISDDIFSCTDARNVEALVVAGGGGGGGYSSWDSGGGGAGAGGLLSSSSYSIALSSNTTVTVGAGGVGGSATTHESGYSGEDSVFGSLTAIGGGGGGSRDRDGLSGGSGGSGGNGSGYDGGAGTSGQGNSGHGNSGSKGGGGGGAGVASTSQTGGNGLEYNITGTSTYYAGGGGGKSGSTAGSGGLGGGGNSGSAGTNGTGGGGGSNIGSTSGFNGGSGIVIIRYCIGNLTDPGSC